MDWIQVATIVGVNIALIATMITLVMWAMSKIDNDVKSIGNRLDQDIKSIGNRLDGHAQRIDQLYGIIVQMLKDKKG